MLALDREVDTDYSPVREYCELQTVPHSTKNSLGSAVRNLFSDLPYNISKYQSKRFDSALFGLLNTRSFDVVRLLAKFFNFGLDFNCRIASRKLRRFRQDRICLAVGLLQQEIQLFADLTVAR